MRHRLIPLIVMVAAFAAVPPLVHRLFPRELPATALTLHEATRKLPPIEFQDKDGQRITLERFRGRFVLLNFWATWCPPCKDEMPSLNNLASRVATNDLAIVPISIDVSGTVRVRNFYDQLRLDRLPIFVDPSANAMHQVAAGIPTTLLINRDGDEIGRLVGPTQWDSPGIVDRLLEFIQPAKQ